MTLGAICVVAFFVPEAWAGHSPEGVCVTPEAAKQEVQAEQPAHEMRFLAIQGSAVGAFLALYNAAAPPTDHKATAITLVLNRDHQVMTVIGPLEVTVILGFLDGCMSFHATSPRTYVDQWLKKVMTDV